MIAAQRAAKGLPPEQEKEFVSKKKNVFGSLFGNKAKVKLNALASLTNQQSAAGDSGVGAELNKITAENKEEIRNMKMLEEKEGTYFI